MASTQRVPGFTKDDRHWLDRLLNDIGYADAFREVFVNEPAYSWFLQLMFSRCQILWAWRTDLQLVSHKSHVGCLLLGMLRKDRLMIACRLLWTTISHLVPTQTLRALLVPLSAHR